jgi:hypothetical protein
VNVRNLSLIAALALMLALPAHASSTTKRGGWDGNGTSAGGTAGGQQPVPVRGIELPAS